MRVLWLCNIMLPVIAKHLGKEVNNKEGWLSGTYDRLKKADFRTKSGEKIELGICFPVADKHDELRLTLPDLEVFGFYEDTNHPEIYEPELEGTLKKIVEKFQPDLVHCFGTEYPHTLAMTRAFGKPDKILIGIQGLCSLCADAYMADLPVKVQRWKTFRDVLKKDSVARQQEKFKVRGENEIEALQNTGHVTGRTAWDKEAVGKISKAKYHFMNETLRNNFYDGEWNLDDCSPHSLFMSQGDYPLKGLHFVLNAMPEVLKKYPDTILYIAGNDLTKTDSLKDKIKISGYGKYLKKIIRQNKLREKVVFLGRLNADEMKQQFLKSNVYICASTLENSPNSLGEAMLLGVPCIASNTGGIPTVFTSGEDGLVFEVGKVDELASKILFMFDNPKEAAKFGSTAKQHATVTHNPNENYRRLLEIYQEIV